MITESKSIEFIRARNRAYNAKWREKHRDELRIKMRLYMRQPKERERQQDLKGKRRAKERGSSTGRIDWKTVWSRFDGTCPLCAKPLDAATEKWHRDHIIPIAVGGPHTTENLQIVHATCNQSKNRYRSGELRPSKPKAAKKKYINTEVDKQRQKAWRTANPERQREFERVYRERHKEKIRLRHKAWVAAKKERTTKITISD